MADLGVDIRCLTDIDPTLSLVSGRECLALSVARRWWMNRGALFYDPDAGTNVIDRLNDDISDDEAQSFGPQLEDEALKDERVQACEVDVTFDSRFGRLVIKSVLQDADGPFRLILAVSDVTAAILGGSDVPATVLTETAAAPPVAAQGEAGPPGPTGPAGASGGTQERTVEFDDESEVTGTTFEFADEHVHDFSGLPSSLTAQVAADVASSSGTGTWRIYIGGTSETLDGTLVATITATASGFVQKSASGAFTNPTGVSLIKVFGQASGAAETTSFRNASVTILPA